MGKISIYQVFTRLFGNTNTKMVLNGSLQENGVGKMLDFNDIALQSIKELGITHIWYTGIIEHATCESYPNYHIGNQNPTIVKGRAGSPYAITDYYDVNPYLANDVPSRMAEFEDLIARTHKNGLKAIIDFVPNHVARQYHSDIFPDRNFGLNDDSSKSFSPKNDFYYIPNQALQLGDGMGTVMKGENYSKYYEYPAKATGNDQFHAHPSINDWYETVKLNYGVDYTGGKAKHFDPIPPLWDKMVSILNFWCSKQVDGIRCDMAEMVPVEFWEYAIKKVKENYPEIIFIAEVYQPSEYHNYIKKGGFDYLYDKVGLYDCLRNIICYETPAYEITRCWENLGGIDSQMLRFLENHDEQRIASSHFAQNAAFAIPAMVVTATLNNGPVMIYFGQEVGEPATGVSGYSGDDGRTTIFDFFNVPEHQKWMNGGSFDGAFLSSEQKLLQETYVKILNFSISNRAISQGLFYDLMWVNHFEGGPDNRYIYAYLRYFETDRVLIVVNFNKTNSQRFKLKIPEDALNLMDYTLGSHFSFKDAFSKTEIKNISLLQAAYEGIDMVLEPLQCCIFVML